MKSLLFSVAVITAFAAAPSPFADASVLPSAPACPPGYFINPDDLSGACLPPTPGNNFVSIAASTTTGEAGWGSGASQKEADRIAVAQCVAATNSICDVVAAAGNGCVAYAVDAASRVFAGGNGFDSESAAASALDGLPNGTVLTVQCSRP